MKLKTLSDSEFLNILEKIERPKTKVFETREELVQELQKRLPTWDNEKFWEVQLWSDLVAMYEKTEKERSV